MNARLWKVTTVVACLGLGSILLGACSNTATGKSSASERKVSATLNVTVNTEPEAVVDGWAVDYALATGLYKKYGLNVSTETISAAGLGAAEAVQSGHLDFGQGAAEYTSIDQAGGDLVSVLTNSVGFGFELYAQPSITSVAGLVGHTIGVAGLTGSFDVVARLLFKQDGINPNNVTFVNLTNITSVLTALLKGDVNSAVLVVGAMTQKASAAGDHLLANMATVFKEPLVGSDTYVTKKYIKTNPVAVQRFVTATMEAYHEMAHNETKTLSIINRVGAGSVPMNDLKIAYRFYDKYIWPKGQIPSANQIGNELPILAESNPAIGKLKPSSLVDPNFARKASLLLHVK